LKPVSVRRRAEHDLFDAIDHYVDHAPEQIEKLLAAIDSAMRSISRSPGLGSPMFAEQLDVPGLRFQPIKGFPYAVFYVELDEELVVVRVLHHARDIASLLDGP
jgi:toxin ParE1/3/4